MHSPAIGEDAARGVAVQDVSLRGAVDGVTRTRPRPAALEAAAALAISNGDANGPGGDRRI